MIYKPNFQLGRQNCLPPHLSHHLLGFSMGRKSMGPSPMHKFQQVKCGISCLQQNLATMSGIVTTSKDGHLSGLVVDTSSSKDSLSRQSQSRLKSASTGLPALLFAQPAPKRHPLFRTPVFVPLIYYYIDFIVEGVMIVLSCYMVTGTAQKVMGIGSAVHAVLIFFTDYQTSEPKVTLFHSPVLDMVIMNAYDWVTIAAIAILPWIVDGFDAVLPKYVYTIFAVIMAPMLIFMDPTPSLKEWQRVWINTKDDVARALEVSPAVLRKILPGRKKIQ